MINRVSDSDAKGQQQETVDPVLAALGMGAELWQDETGDSFVRRLRADNLPSTTVNADIETTRR